MAAYGKLFRYGCLGCLGIVALALLVVGAVSGVAWIGASPEQVEDRVLEPDVPTGVAGEGPPIGRVDLLVKEAELYVKPAGPGGSLRIEARYDVNAHDLAEDFDPGTGDDHAWTYRVTLARNDDAGPFSSLVTLARGSTPRIDVFLPTDVPLDLTLDMRGGAAVVRLGGLWLRTVEVELAAVAIDLSVDEPLHEPMDSLSIHSAAGGALLNRLGNASPRRLDVTYRAGGIDMDLGGQWMRDAEIHIDRGMGGGVVHLPRNVIIEGLDRERIAPPGGSELRPPTLRISTTGGLGRLEFADPPGR